MAMHPENRFCRCLLNSDFQKSHGLHNSEDSPFLLQFWHHNTGAKRYPLSIRLHLIGSVGSGEGKDPGCFVEGDCHEWGLLFFYDVLSIAYQNQHLNSLIFSYFMPL